MSVDNQRVGDHVVQALLARSQACYDIAHVERQVIHQRGEMTPACAADPQPFAGAVRDHDSQRPLAQCRLPIRALLENEIEPPERDQQDVEHQFVRAGDGEDHRQYEHRNHQYQPVKHQRQPALPEPGVRTYQCSPPVASATCPAGAPHAAQNDGPGAITAPLRAGQMRTRAIRQGPCGPWVCGEFGWLAWNASCETSTPEHGQKHDQICAVAIF
jgi:hypothetical protein